MLQTQDVPFRYYHRLLNDIMLARSASPFEAAARSEGGAPQVPRLAQSKQNKERTLRSHYRTSVEPCKPRGLNNA